MIARIRDRDSFVRLRRDGVRLRSGPLWCSYLPDAAMMPPRVGFAIPRSVGSAVARNRLRRRLRATLAIADVPAGLLLVGATPQAGRLPFSALQERVASLMAAAHETVVDRAERA